MKLLYFANIRIPTEKAHGVQIMKMCEAWRMRKQEIELVVPRRHNQLRVSPFDYYGITDNFPITRLWCVDALSGFLLYKPWAYLLEAFTFGCAARWWLRKKTDVQIVTREWWLLLFFPKKFLVTLELHTLPKNSRWFMRALNRAAQIVVITHALKKELIIQSVHSEKITVIPDAVDVDQFIIAEDKITVRNKVQIPQQEIVVLYSGHLYEWKGVDTILRAAQKLPHFLFIFVGGTSEELVNFKKKISVLSIQNIEVRGQKPYPEIPLYLRAADVVVIPNSANSDIGSRYTSPLKLFEYMASGTPIVAAEVPAIKEIVSTNEVCFFKPDDPTDLANMLTKVIQEKQMAQARAEAARALVVARYTWTARAAQFK